MNKKIVLNEYQQAAVINEHDACVVNACVGSGKTTVLIEKIMYLCKEKNVSSKNMVVLTFTNKAADEIKERLMQREELSKNDSFINKEHSNVEEKQNKSGSDIAGEKYPYFGTFHSVALELLKDRLPVETLGYTKDFSVMEPDEELDMAMQLIMYYQLKIKYKNRLKKRLEQAMMMKDDENRKSKYDDDIFSLADLLQKEKVRQNKMSFSDLIDNAVKLLPGYEFAEWIIVDEVQDSDEKQLLFIDALKKSNTKLFAVGDPNQVIYSWRSGSINVFFRLKKKYNAVELSLPLNYRSKSFIIEAAKKFQQQGTAIKGIRNENENGIVIKNHYNPFNEADYMTEKIKQLHSEGIEYNQIGILYRLQSQSEVLEKVLKKNSIPCEISLKKTVNDIPVLKWFVQFLKFAVNSADVIAASNVLSDKKYGLGIKSKDAYAYAKGLAGRDIEAENQFYKKVKSKYPFIEKVIKFKEMCIYLSYFADDCGNSTGENSIEKVEGENSKTESLKISNKLYDYFEMDKYLNPTSADYIENQKYVMDMFKLIEKYCIEQNENVYEGMKKYLNNAALYGMNILKSDILSDNNSVKLMTLHASKGLEFSHVFIIGVNDGLIPLRTGGWQTDEEEQRLFFVGITRAMNYLELSYYTSPDYHNVAAGPGRYIEILKKSVMKTTKNNLENNSSKVNLQELKRQIKKEMATANPLFGALNQMSDLEKSKVNNDVSKCEENNLIAEKTEEETEEENIVTDIENDRDVEPKKIRHVKYGDGIIINEDDNVITAEFEGYGEKEFIKAFAMNQLEYL